MGKIDKRTAFLNDATYIDIYKRLRGLAMVEFEWKGLPPSVSARFIELTLYLKGDVLFFMDKNKDSEMQGNLIALPCTPYGQLNMYREPVAFTATSTGYHAVVEKKDAVLCRNNYDRFPTDMTIRLFAERLTDIQRTIDVNIKAQKTPVVIMCPENKKLTLETIFEQVTGNSPAIFTTNAMDLIQYYKSMPTLAPFIADKAAQAYEWEWNQAMSFLGINNANTQKKERLIVPEADANNQYVDMSAAVMLSCRKEAAEQINTVFAEYLDEEVTVDMRVYREDEGEETDDSDEANKSTDND